MLWQSTCLKPTRNIVCENTRATASHSPALCLWHRCRCVWHLLWTVLHLIITPTDAEYAVLPLPRPLSFLYYLIRPIRLLGKHGLSAFTGRWSTWRTSRRAAMTTRIRAAPSWERDTTFHVSAGWWSETFTQSTGTLPWSCQAHQTGAIGKSLGLFR